MTTLEKQAYPLKWPHGWPRHKGSRDSDTRFNGPTYRWNRVFRGLHQELKKIGASNIVVSTNQPIRGDGEPYAQTRNIDDVGVAVYFMRSGRSMVMAQDRFYTVMGNMRSLTMAIEGLRQMERHGGAQMLERAFEGFAALPPPDSCWKILGMDQSVLRSRANVMRYFKQAAEIANAGNGGDLDRLVKARDEALGLVKS